MDSGLGPWATKTRLPGCKLAYLPSLSGDSEALKTFSSSAHVLSPMIVYIFSLVLSAMMSLKRISVLSFLISFPKFLTGKEQC